MGNPFQSAVQLLWHGVSASAGRTSHRLKPGLLAWAAPLSRRALLGGLLLAAGSALAQPTAPEHEIKANLLARLSQHLEWPASVFATPNQPIVIGLLGDSPTSAEFEETLRAFKPAGRPLQVRRLRRVEEARDCQLLYLHRSEDGKLKTILATLKDQPVFTTGDHADFLKLGGVLRFWRKDDSLAFHINEAALRASKITANPRLLKLSDDPAKHR